MIGKCSTETNVDDNESVIVTNSKKRPRTPCMDEWTDRCLSIHTDVQSYTCRGNAPNSYIATLCMVSICYVTSVYVLSMGKQSTHNHSVISPHTCLRFMGESLMGLEHHLTASRKDPLTLYTKFCSCRRCKAGMNYSRARYMRWWKRWNSIKNYKTLSQ